MTIGLLDGEVFKEVAVPSKKKYWVSNMGRVHNGSKIMKIGTTTGKYRYIHFYEKTGGKRKNHFIHRLVMLTFCPIDNPEEMQVNHKDRDKNNNTLENLEWVTCRENVIHSVDEERIKHLLRNSEKAKKVTQKPIEVTFKEDGSVMEFESIKKAADFLGCGSCYISSVVNGRVKKSKKYQIRFI